LNYAINQLLVNKNKVVLGKTTKNNFTKIEKFIEEYFKPQGKSKKS
jgi:hypothetical protein